MYETSDNLSQALTGDIVVQQPRLEVDWDLDGFGGDDSIDNLSDQSDDLTMQLGLFDGLPDEVSYLSNTGVPTASAALGGREVNGVELTAVQYWSPDYPNSPLYGKIRDIAPVRASIEVVTEAGVESARLFTGLTLDTPLPKGGRARLDTVSLTRLLLAQAIQPPPMDLVARPQVVSLPGGLVFLRAPEPNLTWQVSWALHRCGVYPSPPRVPGGLIWVPLHGARGSFTHAREYDSDLELVSTYGTPTGVTVQHYDTDTEDSNRFVSLSLGSQSQPHNRRFWVPGPYVSGMDAFFDVDNDRVRQIGLNVSMTSVRGATTETIPNVVDSGRFEMYIRGDAADVDGHESSLMNLSAGGSGYASFMTGVLNRAVAWIDADRFVQLWFYPTGYSGTRVELTSTDPLPEDGLWHFLGVAWSVADGKMWINLDGQVDSVTDSNISTTASGSTDWPIVLSFLPLSEFQVSIGDDANPDNNSTWMRDDSWWTRLAYVHPSQLPVFGTVEQSPREAFEYITNSAMAEFATVHIDANDLLYYRPRAWDATADGQTLTQTLTTERDAQTPNVGGGSSRIRNIVRLSADLVQRLGASSSSLTTPPLLEVLTTLEIPPGVSSYEFPLDRLALDTSGSFSLVSAEITPLTQSELDDLDSGTTVIGAFFSNMAVATDESGATVVEEGLTAEVVAISPSVFTIEFTNTAGRSLFLATDVATPEGTRVPYLRLSFATTADLRRVDLVDTDAASLVERGPRVLNASLPQIQTVEAAQIAARRLLQIAARPYKIIAGVELFGDPRRQPGDLVRLVDSDQTGIDGYFRIHGLTNKLTGGHFTQNAQMVEAKLVGRWGDGVSRWGQCLWSAGQSPGIYGE